MTIIGQFRDLDRPDMFVWLRGFDGMEARKARSPPSMTGRCGRPTATPPMRR